ncbi:hypothetical protein [Hwangdonia lutea]|uniref:Adhesin domain-containing protein n=1 Tax=Hwangdonia lutea TaxID=3075823 RepID=A0AA97HRF7_9FLAO|nr:hypothetical protein [Hwangdonia sp. SCSIO 19198]WOD43995.1 hypothetical protein RNZ46_01745 [Hwangdonia sp. SCSIO 19198]
MNKTIIKIKQFALVFLISSGLLAQQKLTKVSQSIKVDKDVTIDLSTSYCNIVFDTWNKGTVEIEAYIESDDLSQEELQAALKDWEVNVSGSQDQVSIKTRGHSSSRWAYSGGEDNEAVHAVLKELKFELADMPDFDFHFDMSDMPELPELPELPKMPKMPELPELPEGVDKIQFDYKAYKKDGEKYMEEYTKNFEKKFGKEYEEKMKAWGEKFGKEWGEKYAEQMEEWAEKFEGKWDNEAYAEKMEAWGKRFAERMEAQAERVEAHKERTQAQVKAHKQRVEAQAKAHEKRAKAQAMAHKERVEAHKKHAKERKKLSDERRVLIERLVNKKSNSKVKKTIRIKMPKGAKLKVNVRHGEIEFAANIDNLHADLSHTKFTAHSINGSSTSINASYSPVYVTHWNLGELNLKYVEHAELNNVRQLVLSANSSNIEIQNLLGSAIIDGSIGNLKILKIDDAFNNLNLILQNSDAVITLPKAGHNLQYKGTRTRFKHPEKTTDNNLSSFTTNNTETNKTIVVNAKYSNVVMQ